MSDDDDFDNELLNVIENDQEPAKKSTQKKKKQPKKPKRRRPSNDDSEEEEYAPGNSSEEESDGYVDDDYDDPDAAELRELEKDPSDSELAGMTVLEQEEFLAERSEKIQRIKERMEVRNRLRGGEGASEQKQQKKSLKELSKMRKQREKAKKQRVYGKDGDNEDEDDEDYQNRIRKSYAGDDVSGRHELKINIDELNSARVRRTQLENWVYAPFFKDVVIGCFVRLMIGTDEQKQPKYRVAQIVEVTDYHRTYKLGTQTTRKALRLKHGKAEKVFLMDVVSNGNFTQSEFDRWVHTMQSEKVRFPSYSELERHKKELNEKNEHVFTGEEIDKIVEEKARSIALPRNLAIDKLNLIAKKEEAEAEGRYEDSKRLAEQISQLDRQSEGPDYMSSIGGETQKKNDVWAKLNMRNRKLNLEEGRKAEMLARQERLVAQKSGKVQNPFARIKVSLEQELVVNKAEAEPETPFTNSSGNLTPIEAQAPVEKRLAENCDALDQALAEVDIELDI